VPVSERVYMIFLRVLVCVHPLHYCACERACVCQCVYVFACVQVVRWGILYGRCTFLKLISNVNRQTGKDSCYTAASAFCKQEMCGTSRRLVKLTGFRTVACIQQANNVWH